MGENIFYISDMSKLAQLKYKKKPIIAQFFTDWCPPCKPARQILQKQMKQCGNKFILACINCDQSEELNIEYEIEGVPTIIAFNNDEKQTVFDKVVGYDARKIKELVDRIKREMLGQRKL